MRDRLCSDVADFDAALAEGRLDAALALRGGELLAGFDDDANEPWPHWLAFERERLRSAWRGAALAWLERDGGCTPPPDSLPAAVGVTRRAELPQAAADTDFIGRASELRRIAALFAEPGVRRLTLVGPGGVGKTRLARRVLDELKPHFADGGSFVGCEDVATNPRIPAMRLPFHPGSPRRLRWLAGMARRRRANSVAPISTASGSHPPGPRRSRCIGSPAMKPRSRGRRSVASSISAEGATRLSTVAWVPFGRSHKSMG